MPALAWRKIVCAVDFSDESRAALRVAVDLASRFGAELTVFHVRSERERVASEPRQEGGGLDQWRADAQKLGAPAVTAASIDGDPRLAIVEFASGNGFDLVVMGTHGRTGRDRLLIGSVAENVVRSSRVPVLTVHAGFLDPG